MQRASSKDPLLHQRNLAAPIRNAAQWILEADALIITAGAGMGADSGLPDFRGPSGWWITYPSLYARGLSFQDIACPRAFCSEPNLAWGFYGQRLLSYRRAQPHMGFDLINQWVTGKRNKYFIYTSNVDGHFQKAGFSINQIEECHGSIHYLQCLSNCAGHIWSADNFIPEVDPTTQYLLNAPPRCTVCGDLARPNILMFNDSGWLEHRNTQQAERLEVFLESVKRPLVLEIGAGNRISTVRSWGEQVARRYDGRLIRINPESSKQLSGHIQLPLTGLKALSAIQAEMQRLQGCS